MELIKQSIRDRLASGPVWTRSFQGVKAALNRMIADGEVIRCKPPGGRANNMVCLYKAPPPRLSPIDLFAERLSVHGDIRRAAEELGRSSMWGFQSFDEICRALGPQAF